MDKKIKRYVNEVFRNISVDRKIKNRLKEDLMTQINEKAMYRDVNEVLNELGNPKSFAYNLIDEDETLHKNQFIFEYKTKKTVFGIPLIHICYNKNGFRGNVAKGIIAIAPISFGVLPFGAISFGLVSFGALSLGLVSLGSVSIGLLLSLGSVSVGTGAIGAVAIGYIARGAVAIGHTAIGEQAIGQNVLEGKNLSSTEVFEFIKSNHSNLKEWIIRLFSF